MEETREKITIPQAKPSAAAGVTRFLVSIHLMGAADLQWQEDRRDAARWIVARIQVLRLGGSGCRMPSESRASGRELVRLPVAGGLRCLDG